MYFVDIYQNFTYFPLLNYNYEIYLPFLLLLLFGLYRFYLVMQLITHDGSYASQIYVLINYCRSLFTREWIVLPAHIYRKANGVADGRDGPKQGPKGPSPPPGSNFFLVIIFFIFVVSPFQNFRLLFSTINLTSLI